VITDRVLEPSRFKSRDIIPILERIKNLPNIQTKCDFSGKFVTIESIDTLDNELSKEIISIAKSLKPWRKGPFKIFGTTIDTEWDSDIKYAIIKDALDIKDKSVIDIGCNNGYYMFRMLEKNPKRLIGFDPGELVAAQFCFLNKFIKSDIGFELLGVENLASYKEKFDVALCLGVIYHRKDPFSMLRDIRNSLNIGGEIILDSLILEGEGEIALIPKERYAMMPNVYFVPTINALKNMLHRAGFGDIELIAIKKTDQNEQRATEWIDSLSLENFVDFENGKTIEGYPAPIRGYLKARRA